MAVEAAIDIQNRIVNYGVKPADEFTAHPLNARMHPQFQRDVMKAALQTVGFVAPIIESLHTGFLLDGHERVWQGLQNKNANIPYVVVDVTEDEEAYILATFDPITSLAHYDSQKLDELLRDVQSDDAAIQQMLSDLAMKPYIPDDVAQLEPFLDGDHTVTIHCSFEALSDIKPILETWTIRDDITVNIS